MPNLKNRETGEVASQSEVDRRIRAVASWGPTINYDECGWDVIFPAPAPAFDPTTHHVREAAPVLTPLGTLQQTWEVVALDAQTAADNQQRDIEQNNARIKAEIAVLDLKRIRPLAEGDAAFLADLNTQITALRAQLT